MFSTYNKWESISSRRALIISCLGARTRNYTRSNQAWSWENWLRFIYTFFRVSIASLKRAFRCFQGCTECMVLRVEWWEKMGIYMWKLHVLLYLTIVWFALEAIAAYQTQQQHFCESRRWARWLNLSGMFIMKSQLFSIRHHRSTETSGCCRCFGWVESLWRRCDADWLGITIHVSSGRRKA